MNAKITAAIAIAILVAGCAKPASSIKAVSLESNYYETLDCQKIIFELEKEHRGIKKLTKQQNGAALADAVGVFMIFVPTASLMGGDRETELAFTKGKLNALASAYNKKKCGPSSISIKYKAESNQPSNDIIYAE